MGHFQTSITFDSAGTNKTYTTSANQSVFLVKYNCNNIFQWCLRVSGTAQYSYAAGCVKARKNSLFLITSFQSSATIISSNNNSTTKTGTGTYSGLVLKINANGVLSWANTIESSAGKVELDDIEISQSGSIYIAGLYTGTTATAYGQNSTSVTTGSNLGFSDALMVKYNSLGEAVWKLTGGGSGDDVAGYFVSDYNGNLYASGQYSCCGTASSTFGSFTLSNGTGWATWISKIDTSGSYSWIIGQTGDYGCAGGLQVDEKNYLYFTGNFKSTKTVKSWSATGYTKSISSNGGTDIVLAKYTPAGELLWAKSFGSAGDDYSHRSFYRKGKFYVHAMIAGSVSITQGSTTYTFTNAGNTDDILTVYDSSGVFLGGSIISGTGSEKSNALEFSDIGKLMIGGYFDGTIATNSLSLTSSGGQDGYMYIFDSTNVNTSLIFNRTDYVCLGDSIKIRTGLSAGTYQWTPAATLNDASVVSPYAKPATNAVYVLKYTNAQGCIYYDTARIYVDTISISVSSNTSICQYDSVQINAAGGNSYTWSPTTGLSNPNIANPFARPSVTTTYNCNGEERGLHCKRFC